MALPVDIAEIGELDPRAVPRIDSGVTWFVFDGKVWFRRRILSGVGLEGDVSAEETDSEPDATKLFISDRAGARIPGSAEVKAFTAGYTMAPILRARDC